MSKITGIDYLWKEMKNKGKQPENDLERINNLRKSFKNNFSKLYPDCLVNSLSCHLLTLTGAWHLHSWKCIRIL